MKRKSEVMRKTSETDIAVRLVLGSRDKSLIESGVPFLDHMLDSMSRHGHFFIELKCKGDYELDFHHTVEDAGIVLGKAFKDALGDKAGIMRFGNAIIPMDDALTLAAVDLSGRAYFKYTGAQLKGYINRYNEELTLEFLRSFAVHAEINLHVMLFYGENRHHIHESIFKSLGVALYKAYTIDDTFKDDIPSTKGTIV